MIRVKTDGPEAQDPDYRAAQGARERALTTWKSTGKRPRRGSTYKRLKDFLNRVFEYKCGYCETRRSGGQKSIDHYRPTNEVTDNRRPVAHSGYWWLAYEWYNLVPVCEECNEWNDKAVHEKLEKRGKKSEFRVLGNRVFLPSDDPSAWRSELKAEEPLLLNPYEDEPRKHISFDLDSCYPVGKTPRGNETIEVCGLDRDDLFTARRAALERLQKIMIGELYEGISKTKEVPVSEEHSAFLNLWLKRYCES